MQRKLYRSRSDRMLMGVCGGLAAYFDLDSTLVRLATVILLLLTHVVGVVVYVIFGLVIPLEPTRSDASASEPTEQLAPSPPASPELASARDTIEDVASQAQTELEQPK